MNECKHGNTGECELCSREDAEHDAAMAANFEGCTFSSTVQIDAAELAELRKDAERWSDLCNKEGALDSFTAAYWNTNTVSELEAAFDDWMQARRLAASA